MLDNHEQGVAGVDFRNLPAVPVPPHFAHQCLNIHQPDRDKYLFTIASRILYCLVKQFAIYLGVVVILLFNVMEVLSVEVFCWRDCVWSSNEYVGVPVITVCS